MQRKKSIPKDAIVEIIKLKDTINDTRVGVGIMDTISQLTSSINTLGDDVKAALKKEKNDLWEKIAQLRLKLYRGMYNNTSGGRPRKFKRRVLRRKAQT